MVKWAAASVCVSMSAVVFAAPGGLTLIPSPAGWVYAEGQSITDDGRVLVRGSADYSGNQQTTIWSASQGHQPLVMPEATSLTGWRMTEQGWIVGTAVIDSVRRDFRWSSATGFQIAPDGMGVAYSISSSGAAAVNYYESAYRWEADGSQVALEELTSDAYYRTTAWGISPTGVVLGAVATGGGHQRAAMWDQTGAVTVLGLPDSTWGTHAILANSAGDIAGISSEPGGMTPFILKGGVGGQLLMLDGGGAYTRILDMDERGNVVGTNGADMGALWLSDGTYIDLTAWAREMHPEFEWLDIHTAAGINEHGVITGMGTFDGQRVAYMLDASGLVPEPGAMVVVAMSAGLLLRRRRTGQRRAA